MSIEGLTERTAKEDTAKPGSACPYHAERILPERYEAPGAKWLCGESGWLCDMCKADRADARTDRLVEGMALAGLLASPVEGEEQWSAVYVTRFAARLAAALREREGGER